MTLKTIRLFGAIGVEVCGTDLRYIDDNAFGGNWHTNQMLKPTPAMVTLLYAKEVPEAGGDKLFGNLCLTYDTISYGIKEENADLPIFNFYKNKKRRSSEMNVKLKELEKPTEAAEHPLVQTDSKTGKPDLYICYGHITRHIVYWAPEKATPSSIFWGVIGRGQSLLADFVGSPAFWHFGTIGESNIWLLTTNTAIGETCKVLQFAGNALHDD